MNIPLTESYFLKKENETFIIETPKNHKPKITESLENSPHK